jgi:hypothetical protein
VTGALRTVYRYWALILFLAVIVQIFLAGLGAFAVAGEADDGATVDEDLVDDKFGPHGALGFFIGPGALLLFLIALGARLGRNRVLLSLGVLALWFLQEILAGAGTDVSFVGGLHAANALVILGLTGYLAERSWRKWTDLGRPAETPVAT